MICKPCRQAGVMNQTGQAWMFRVGPPGFMEYEVVSEPAEMHERCEYPVTCPCQHRVRPPIGTFVAL